MATSHHCSRCGCTLRHLASPIDPIYGLPILTCPGCGRSTVRRRHPLASAWRWFRRFDLASGVFLVQLACAAGALAVATALVWEHAPGSATATVFGVHRAPAVLFMSFAAGAVGAWVGLGLGHHGILRASAGFFCAVLVLVTASYWLGPVVRRASLGAGVPFPPFPLGSMALPAAWLLLPGALGVAAGTALRRGVQALWPFWWRRSLRRMRRSRRLT